MSLAGLSLGTGTQIVPSDVFLLGASELEERGTSVDPVSVQKSAFKTAAERKV